MPTLAEQFVEKFTNEWNEHGYWCRDWKGAGYTVRDVEDHGGIVVGVLEPDEYNDVTNGYRMVAAPIDVGRMLVFTDASYVVDDPNGIQCHVGQTTPKGPTIGNILHRWAKLSDEAVRESRAVGESIEKDQQTQP